MRVVQGNQSTIADAAMLWLDMVRESRPDWRPDLENWCRMASLNMQAGHYFQLFALDDEKRTVAGFGDFFLFPEPSTGKLHCTGQHFYVRPEYRKGRAGAMLYRAWLRFARDAGASVVELFAFNDEQARWLKCGFEPVRVLMRKEV